MSKRLYTRFAKMRGVWYAMNSNVEKDQADQHHEEDWSEEESVYVPNDFAVAHKALEDAARGLLRDDDGEPSLRDDHWGLDGYNAEDAYAEGMEVEARRVSRALRAALGETRGEDG